MAETVRVTARLPRSLVNDMDAAIADGEYVDRGDLVRAALRSFLGAL